MDENGELQTDNKIKAELLIKFGVLHFFVIDLLTLYVLDILSANLFQSSSISPWASSKFQSVFVNNLFILGIK
jgi:predicted nuclease of restriction endonuclease-like RecB superfamily